MKLFVRGKRSVDVSDDHRVGAPGGQGTVYSKGNVAYKVYHDPGKGVPVGKIEELAVLDHPLIMRPTDVLLNAQNEYVGYSMPFVAGTESLTKLTSQRFKLQKSLGTDKLVALILNLTKTQQFVHDRGCLMVDINLLNFLVDRNFEKVFCIDVDSYQTPHYPACALMQSVRDYSARTYGKGSDYFSLGVCAFEVLTSIHPYKGNHPEFGFPITPEILEQRMRRGVSVFDTKVGLPPSVQPFDALPAVYLEWFKALFVRGKRVPPPTGLTAAPVVIVPRVKHLSGSNHWDVAEILELPEPITFYYAEHGIRAALSATGVYIGRRKELALDGDFVVGHTAKMGRVVAAAIKGGKLVMHNVSGGAGPLSYEMAAEQIMSYGGSIYVKQGNAVFEMQFAEIGLDTVIPTSHPVANVHTNATTLYEGVAVQYVMKQWRVNVFFKPGQNVGLPLPEIEGTVIDAKYDRQVLVVVATKNGRNTRYVFRFSPDFSAYDTKVVKDVDSVGINFVVVDTGVCALMNEQDEIELFRNRPNDPDTKVVKDAAVSGDVTLFRDGPTLLLVGQNRLSSLRLKP
jgi:hypothetical protein